MRIIRTITLSEIPVILDRSLEDYRSTGKKSNILFLGEEGFGKSSTVRRWIVKNRFEVTCDLYPNAFESMPEGTYQYSFVDVFLAVLATCNVLFNCRLNMRKEEGISELAELIKNRSYKGFYGEDHDFKDLFLVVATAIPDNGKNDVFSLENPIFDLFEIYNVVPTVDEVSRHLIDRRKRIIARLSEELLDYEKNNGEKFVEFCKKFHYDVDKRLKTDREDIKEYEAQIGILKKLVGLDITFDTIAPRVFNNKLSLCDTLEEFIKELSREYKDDADYWGPETGTKTEAFLSAIEKALLRYH